MEITVPKTKRGRRFRLTEVVDGSLPDVRPLLFAVEHWTEWGPFLTDVDYDYETVRANTEGSVQLLGGIWFPFRVEEVSDTFWRWSVAGLVPPADGHRVEQTEDRGVEVSFELPLWAPFYLPVCALALRSIRRMTSEPAE